MNLYTLAIQKRDVWLVKLPGCAKLVEEKVSRVSAESVTFFSKGLGASNLIYSCTDVEFIELLTRSNSPKP